MINSSKYVLILDPDSGARAELAELFDEAGYEVEEEAEAARAITRVMRRDPSVVVMAEKIPSLDGVEILPLLRRLTKAPIVVTGDGDDTSSVVRVLLDGGDAFIGRPLNRTELMARVRALLRRSDSTRNGNPTQVGGLSIRPHRPLITRTSVARWTRLGKNLLNVGSPAPTRLNGTRALKATH